MSKAETPSIEEDVERVEEDEDGGVEYQVPTNETKPKNLGVSGDEHDLVNQTGETGTLDVKVEVGAILKRIAEDTYDRDKVGIRELLANAETSCKVAMERYDGYSPIIEVEYTHDGELIVYDNGIGIESEIFDKVVRHIARTTSGDEGDMSGQMGMGMFSVRNLMEDDASCMITTCTRENDEEYKVYMHNSGFDPIPGGFEEPKYGTEFKIPIKDGFSNTKVRSSVREFSRFLDVSVIYTEYDRNGDEQFQEEWGEETLEEQYEDDLMVTYEDENVKAVCSPSADEKTFLCSMPINRNDPKSGYSGSTAHRKAPHGWDLIVKQEDGREWEGADGGGIHLPEPTSDRDRLSLNNEGKFYNHISEKLSKKYQERLKEAVEKIDDMDSILHPLRNDMSEFKLLREAIRKINSYKHDDAKDLQEAVKEQANTDITLKAAKFLREMNNSMDFAPRGCRNPSRKDNRTSKYLYEIIRDDSDGDVYMGKTINGTKAQIVWDLDDENQVVRLESGSSYEEYEQKYGWKKLRDIKVSDKRDEVSDSLRAKLDDGATTNGGKPVEEREVVVRKGSRKRKMRVEEIVDALENESMTTSTYSGGNGKRLIVFGYDTDYKISGWKEFFSSVGEYSATIGTKMVTDHLDDEIGSKIMHIDDIVTKASEVEVTTTEGDVTLGEESDRLLLHPVDKEDLERFREDDIMEELQELAEENLDGIDDPLYAPVSKEAGLKLSVGIKELSIPVIDYDREYDFSSVRRRFDDYSSDEELYAVARLNEWDKLSDEMRFLRNAINNSASTTNVFNPIEMFAKFHDADVKPVSELPGEVNFTLNGKQTSLGETEAPSVPADD